MSRQRRSVTAYSDVTEVLRAASNTVIFAMHIHTKEAAGAGEQTPHLIGTHSAPTHCGTYSRTEGREAAHPLSAIYKDSTRASLT